MELPVERRLYSIAEYLELEAKAEFKSEFHDGEILAMSGGSYAQSKIKTNLVAKLHAKLQGHRCEPLDSDMRVRISKHVNYVYPDALVLCGPPEFDPDDRKKTTILNPTVIFEVLSESTEAYDRGKKFELYQKIPTMQEYVLIAQDAPRIDVYYVQPDGRWAFSFFEGLGAKALLRSIQLELPLAEIYSGIVFEKSAGS